MTKRLLALLAPALTIAVAACATTTPPPRHSSDDDMLEDSSMTETSAEWLYVTAHGKRANGAQAECGKVAGWLEKEAACTGELCLHARDLGRSWLQRCEKIADDKMSAMQDLVGRFEERSDLPSDSCIREGISLLRTQDCGEPGACELQAQRWISKCGKRYATPLIVLMLTSTLERRFPDDPNQEKHVVRFDTRDCAEMAAAIGGAVGCDGMDACKDAVETSAAWMDRCFDKNVKVPITLAFQIADVRIGAGMGVEPIPVSPIENRLTDDALPLMIDDNKGAIAWTCGLRPKTVKDYVDARRGCQPGEVIVTRLDGAHAVRAVSVPHANDEEFSRLFSFLAVKGEREARGLAEVDAFRAAIAEAVEAAGGRRPDAAVPMLVRALRDHEWTVARQPSFQRILTDADGALSPAFKAWGASKVKKSYRIRGKDDAALFAGRAVQSPLNDMARDGSVSPGAYAAPFALTLEKWMPQSVRTYRSEVEPLAAAAERRRPSDAVASSLRTRVLSEIRACGEAETAIQSAAEAVTACMFKAAGCTQDQIASLAAKADPDRRRAAAARVAIQTVLTSGVIDQAEIDRLEAERLSSGCLDP